MEWAVLFVENKNCQLTNFRKLKKFAAVVETEKTVPRFSNNFYNEHDCHKISFILHIDKDRWSCKSYRKRTWTWLLESS